jgi:hypothetical protein
MSRKTKDGDWLKKENQAKRQEPENKTRIGNGRWQTSMKNSKRFCVEIRKAM